MESFCSLSLSLPLDSMERERERNATFIVNIITVHIINEHEEDSKKDQTNRHKKNLIQ